MMQRRLTDQGALGHVIAGLVAFWDWVDRRQLDAWGVLIFSLVMTVRVLEWGIDFADSHPDMDGLKTAAIITAIVAPWVTMQAALVKFHFDARRGSFLPTDKLTAPAP